MKRKIKAITAVAGGERVIIGDIEFKHANKKHFNTLPSKVFLNLLKTVLENPTTVYK